MANKLLEREFLTTVLLNVGVVAAALSGALAPKWAAIASAVSVAAFNVSRGLAKQEVVVPAKPPVAVVPAPPVA